MIQFFFEKGVDIINKTIELVEEALIRMEEWEYWGFKLFSQYEVRLTAYGPGGSYDFKEGKLLMKVNKKGSFSRSPAHTIIHEIIHIGIEELIVKKFGLNHSEKEGLIDSICVNYFGDLLLDYKIQERGNKKVFDLISPNNIADISKIIKSFKNK